MKNKVTKSGLALIAMVLILAMVVTGCAASQKSSSKQPTPEPEKVKVAFIYTSPAKDEGWSQAHDEARKFLEKEMPMVETTFVESVPENADAESVLTELAMKGNKIIFATSFGYMDSVINVARNFPEVTFLHCAGFKTAPNVGSYFGRIYQARYLSGMAAGKQTQTNTIGYVAAFPIPEVIRGINAFTLGARAVNPNVTVKVAWTNTWYDPAVEKEVAEDVLKAGADVIAMHQNTPASMQAAEEKGKFAVSYNTDMRSQAPKAVLTGPVWNWGPYYVKTVKAVLDQRWKPDQYWGPMSDKIVDISPYGPMVNEATKNLITKKKEEIVKGQWDVFIGPIKDQQGNVKIPDGQRMSDKDMLEFDWFVQGIDGTI